MTPVRRGPSLSRNRKRTGRKIRPERYLEVFQKHYHISDESAGRGEGWWDGGLGETGGFLPHL